MIFKGVVKKLATEPWITQKRRVIHKLLPGNDWDTHITHSICVICWRNHFSRNIARAKKMYSSERRERKKGSQSNGFFFLRNARAHFNKVGHVVTTLNIAPSQEEINCCCFLQQKLLQYHWSRKCIFERAREKSASQLQFISLDLDGTFKSNLLCTVNLAAVTQ